MLGAIFWCEVSGELSCPWEGNLGELLVLLNANVEDRVKQLREWPSSPQGLYRYLRSLDGYLFRLYGGDVEVEMRNYSKERPEDTKVLIELVFPDDFEDDPEGEGEHYTGFEFDFDWIAPEDRDEG